MKQNILSPKQNIVHIIGIGGIGTSALARWFLSQRWKVSGSDISSSQITERLKKEGAKIFIGHKAQNLPQNAKLVVRSAAVGLDNAELVKALKLGIPVRTYAQTLGDLTRKYKAIAVTGAHGKGTSTALLSLALIRAGFDPTVIIGTNLKEFGNKNFRKGKSPYLIIEADEYQGHFLHHSPIAAMITNIDKEHLDFFKNLNHIKNIFLRFIENVQPGGIIVANKDDKNLYSLRNKIEKIARKKNIKVNWYSVTNPHNRKNLLHKLEKTLKIPGNHNISNALGVYTLAKTLGAKEKDIFPALSSYRGAWRRMEYRGKFQFVSLREISRRETNLKFKISVYDDYAHHPTEIKATLSGLVKKYPDHKIICVFQPHQAKRLEALFKEFTRSFDDSHILILLDIFKVTGRDSSKKVSHNVKSITSATLAGNIKQRLKPLKNRKKWTSKTPQGLETIIYLPHSKGIEKRLKLTLLSIVQSLKNTRAIVVMMGAGDIYKMTDKLVK